MTTLWLAVFADMGTSLLVTANGLRLHRDGGVTTGASRMRPAKARSRPEVGSPRRSEEASVGVTIYTKIGCPYCAAAKADLQARGVVYDEIDVHSTPGAMEKLAELTAGQMVVPAMIEDGDVRVGFGGG